MAPSSAHLRQSGLTDSWASMNADAKSVHFTSDEEDIPQPLPLPKVNLTSSRVNHLRDALGNTTSARSPGPIRESPRKRNLTHSRHQDQSGFVMPTLEHTSSHEGNTSPSRPPARDDSQAISPRKNTRTRLPRRKPEPTDSNLDLLWQNILAPSLSYLLSILGLTLNMAKPVLAYGLALYLLAGGLIITRNMLFTRVTTALAPLCHIPGSAYLVPLCANLTAPVPPHGSVEFDKLVATQSAFEDVLSHSAESAGLPMDMKRSEASIRDLRHVVQYSALPSRNELVFEFGGFVDTARQASADLARYNARIGRAVDRILSTNRWTLQVLDGIAGQEADRGAVARFVAENLDIFRPFRAVAKGLGEVLFEQYLRHTAEIEEQILMLIEEAQALLAVLQNLDDRLDVISSIAVRDGLRVEENKDELLAMLWTKLGGNKASVSRVQKQLSVLREVGAYRKLAFAHVSATVVKLQAIAAALEDLRERVARPEVLGVEGGVGGGKHDIPLQMHIGEIVMGVERLEGVRDEGRRVEGRRLKGILDREERLGVEGAS